jgi:transmembrane sensor
MDSRQIEERALAWLARRDSGRWSDADQLELGQWLEADTLHRVAFLRLEAGWERTARLKAFGAGMKPGVVPPSGQLRTSPFFERRPASTARSANNLSVRKVATIAAGALLAIGAGLYLKTFRSGEDYTTPVGGVASIPLRDGSSMTLNTRSRVRVTLTDTERRIQLEEGEAFFNVAKDPARPFIVLAGNQRVVAIGTQFSVRRAGNDVQVVVTEGKVRAEPKNGGQGGELLAAGAVLHAARDSLLVEKKTVRDVEATLSWRSGYLTFDETSLADAVAEFNRYTAQRIVIEDPRLAAVRINGKFRSTHAEDFVELLRHGFGIQVQQTEETITLSSN